MRGMPTKQKAELEALGLWRNACLMCGSRINITAEHSVSGMGGRSENSRTIIPLCFSCHIENGHSDKPWARAVGTFYATEKASHLQAITLDYQQARRIADWGKKFMELPSEFNGMLESMQQRWEEAVDLPEDSQCDSI